MTDNTTPVKEIKIPVADPNDPYAIPAAMPSSVDHAVRSFNAGDYPEPSRKQDEWRYTPIERINEFFTHVVAIVRFHGVDVFVGFFQ